MPRLSDLVKYVNDTLVENAMQDKRFDGAGLYGIATQVPFAGDDGIAYKQVILAEDGEVILDDCFYDQTEPLRLFHIINNSSYSADPLESFGNGMAFRRTCSMSIVCFADRKRIQMSGEDLEMLLYAGMPTKVPSNELPQGIKNCTISPSGSQLNQAVVMYDRFKLNDHSLEPDAVLIEFKYILEYTADRSCIQLFCCP